jgi:hypothetical protein
MSDEQRSKAEARSRLCRAACDPRASEWVAAVDAFESAVAREALAEAKRPRSSGTSAAIERLEGGPGAMEMDDARLVADELRRLYAVVERERAEIARLTSAQRTVYADGDGVEFVCAVHLRAERLP